jgi:DNA-binding Lrp family transcriptional regulator
VRAREDVVELRLELRLEEAERELVVLHEVDELLRLVDLRQVPARPRPARTLRQHPEVVEAWSVTGEADAIARVRAADNADLERLIIDLQKNRLVVRTRSQVVLSRL